jgi:hypothetical protein
MLQKLRYDLVRIQKFNENTTKKKINYCHRKIIHEKISDYKYLKIESVRLRCENNKIANYV